VRPVVGERASFAPVALEEKLEDLKQTLLRSARLYTWAELAMSKDLPPAKSGVYAWFFASAPLEVPVENCIQRGDRHLLYVGISPSSSASGETLRSRIRYHFRGNAEGSTFGKTLGCLLESRLGTVLRRVGSGKRMTFGPQEPALTRWIAETAAVAWIESAKPWVLEKHILATVGLPLNIDDNDGHPFRLRLREIRDSARRRARQLPILAGS